MDFRTMLVAAGGGAASDGAVELACRLALRFDAHLEVFHARIDPREIVALASDGFAMPLAAGWLDQLNGDIGSRASEARKAFDAAIMRHGLWVAPAPLHGLASAAWREETGYAPFLVSRRARFFDLVVLGRSERVVDRPYSGTVEETLLYSGRPVLLAPDKAPSVIGETIAVGWNGSAAAVRALTGSIPLLKRARAVSILTIGDEADAVSSVLDYLDWRGIAASHQNVPSVEGVAAGQQLLAGARDNGADLLVMGGYGHLPWREFLFGGATREIVGVSLLPLLLSH